MSRNWDAKSDAQAGLDNLHREERELYKEYGPNWKEEAPDYKLGYIYELENNISWGDLD